MLVLTRKRGERIMIGDNIVVTLVSVKGKQAQIGIDAPVDVIIHREEIFEEEKHKIEKPEYKGSGDY